MGSLSFAEIVTILLVILVIFGPDRLPEFARKIGELMAQARRVTSQFTKEISSEWGEAVEPILSAKKEFDGVKKDLKDATATLTGLGAAAEPTDHQGAAEAEAEAEADGDGSQKSEADEGDESVPLSRGTGEHQRARGIEGAKRPTTDEQAETEGDTS